MLGHQLPGGPKHVCLDLQHYTQSVPEFSARGTPLDHNQRVMSVHGIHPGLAGGTAVNPWAILLSCWSLGGDYPLTTCQPLLDPPRSQV